MLKAIKIVNFRCFEKYSVNFKDMNVIVGQNNAGKSTLIEALRIIYLITSRYQSLPYNQPPEWLALPKKIRGVRPSLKASGLSFGRTSLHRYEGEYAEIVCYFTNGIKIHTYISALNEIFAVIYYKNGEAVKNKSEALDIDIPKVNILPPIGPLLRTERKLYSITTNSSTLSSQHFRNELLLLKEQFSSFKSLSEETWERLVINGLDIVDSEDDDALDQEIKLWIRDGDFEAEIGWMGNGLQMWLQIMWFLSKSNDQSTIILDEPDIYMHPLLQRKLIRVLHKKYNQTIVTTHSVEIIAEVDHENILMLDKNNSESSFADSIPSAQYMLDHLGGIHNLQLTRLGVSRKCLFIEGKDVQLLQKFYEIYNSKNTENIFDTIPSMPINGRENWSHVLGIARFLNRETNGGIKVFCILDKDYHSEAEIQKKYKDADLSGVILRIWTKKELENYLIIPSVIQRVIEKFCSKNNSLISEQYINKRLDEIIETHKDSVFDKISEEYRKEDRSKQEQANAKARQRMKKEWTDFDSKTAKVNGKDFLSDVSKWTQTEFGVSLSKNKLLQNMKPLEIHNDLKQFFILISSTNDKFLMQNAK